MQTFARENIFKSFKFQVALLSTFLLVGLSLVATPTPARAEALANQNTFAIGDTFSQDISFDCALQPGETGPITYSIDGTLPTGITLNPVTGIVSGTFTEAGTWDLVGSTWCNYTGSNGNPAAGGYPTDAHFTVIPEAATFTPPPTVQVEATGGPNCELLITGTFPEVQDAGTGHLRIESDQGSVTLTLTRQTAATPFVFAYSINDPRPLESPLVVSAQTSGDIYCSTLVDVSLSYQYNRAPAASTSVNNTFAVFQLENTPFVTQVPYGDGLCGLYLTGRFPMSGDLGTHPTVSVYGEDSEVSVIPTLDRQGVFQVWLPLDDLREFDYEYGSLILNGQTPDCNQMLWVTAKIWVEGTEMTHNTWTYVSRSCDPGTFDTGSVCAPAPIGSYVPARGMNAATLCPKGTFQNAIGAVECIDAPIGSYVSRKGATSATLCPQGKVTEETGSTNVSECYALKNQAFTTLKASTKLKFGAAITVPAVTDNLIPVTVTATGACTQTETTMTVKVGKVSRTVRAVRITAGTVAGNCNVSFANNGDAFYRPYSKNLVIKVSRTGK